MPEEAPPPQRVPQAPALAYLAPILLLGLTVGVMWLGQSFVSGALILLIAGSHAMAHRYVARREGVDCSWPYFVPGNLLSGTAGAYVKLTWPITSRASLIRIFTAGPFVGTSLSILALGVGLPFSEYRIPSSDELLLSFEFGNSLLASAFEHLFNHPPSEGHELVISPLAWAGWLGLHFNAWQLLPIGRFDGGRIAVALLGPSRAFLVSVLGITALVALSFVQSAWFALALLGAISHFRLREQYEGLDLSEDLSPTSRWMVLVFFVLAILIFPYGSK